RDSLSPPPHGRLARPDSGGAAAHSGPGRGCDARPGPHRGQGGAAMTIDLPLIWAVILLVAVFMYVVMDGFDLGIGILFPFIRNGDHRDQMMSSIAPVWDGNETWLILGGVGLMPVFPVAFSILFTAFYAPLIAMLLALVFRGVAFEFRYRDPGHRRYWDAAFTLGSLVAAFMQGMLLGTFIQGIAVEDRAYAGGWFD